MRHCVPSGADCALEEISWLYGAKAGLSVGSWIGEAHSPAPGHEGFFSISHSSIGVRHRSALRHAEWPSSSSSSFLSSSSFSLDGLDDSSQWCDVGARSAAGFGAVVHDASVVPVPKVGVAARHRRHGDALGWSDECYRRNEKSQTQFSPSTTQPTTSFISMQPVFDSMGLNKDPTIKVEDQFPPAEMLPRIPDIPEFALPSQHPESFPPPGGPSPASSFELPNLYPTRTISGFAGTTALIQVLSGTSCCVWASARSDCCRIPLLLNSEHDLCYDVCE